MMVVLIQYLKKKLRRRIVSRFKIVGFHSSIQVAMGLELNYGNCTLAWLLVNDK